MHRRWVCGRCGGAVRFTAQRCATCDAELGYDSGTHDIVVLSPTDRPGTFSLESSPELRWRCLNAAWGCNWTVAAGAAGVWCRSCALTRWRPDEHRSTALRAWVVAEAAKRRLVHQLDVLGLPIAARTPDGSDGLAFDFVAVPDMRGMTGYLMGVVTLDLAEVDDVHRDEQRRSLGERHRSVLGHLRHEVGHHYWPRLVQAPDEQQAFRVLFGDERADYRRALDLHYADSAHEWDATRFVSGYATSHPLEDWAETFAVYLKLHDLASTAAAHGLTTEHDAAETGDARTISFDRVLGRWRTLIVALDDLFDAFGGPPAEPLDLPVHVVAKLSFVHELISRHAVVSGSAAPGPATAS